MALALGWLRARPGVSVVLVGARTRSQAAETFAPNTQPLPPDVVQAIDAVVRDVFHPAQGSARGRAAAATWGERERFIVERLDGTTRYETIAALWTDRGEQPMIAAQVKVFVDQLADAGLVG